MSPETPSKVSGMSHLRGPRMGQIQQKWPIFDDSELHSHPSDSRAIFRDVALDLPLFKSDHKQCLQEAHMKQFLTKFFLLCPV